MTAAGAEAGTNDFRISDMGPDGSTTYFAAAASIAYNSGDNQYLVTWRGSDDAAQGSRAPAASAGTHRGRRLSRPAGSGPGTRPVSASPL